MNVGIVGATGMVGTVMRQLLAERKFPVTTLRLFASSRSAGSTIEWNGQTIVVEDAKPLIICRRGSARPGSAIRARHHTIVNSSIESHRYKKAIAIGDTAPIDICR
jgi:aspartate-semialdehyde dehydrogenase